MTASPALAESLLKLQNSPPRTWSETGAKARRNLHALLRYPAMMVPCMQGDIIDVLLSTTHTKCHVLDPFVGSGTVMTESLQRNPSFTGIDINPLAVLICEAKAAIDAGEDIAGPTSSLLTATFHDKCNSPDIEFPGRDKWFDEQSAICLSKIRRAILQIDETPARKFLWTVFSETIRQCSNSRTSTYKLHIRKPNDRFPSRMIPDLFKRNLQNALECANEYRSLLPSNDTPRPSADLFCADVRSVNLAQLEFEHQILVTSPPYGDNQTTIPYGQFSYLAARWIPSSDLPSPRDSQLMTNTNSLDSASLGGTVRGAETKEEIVRQKSPTYDAFVNKAEKSGKRREIRKVSSYLGDFLESLVHLRSSISSTAHWAFTTGNRTVAGLTVPLDGICSDLLTGLGGKPVATLHRRLPNKRMPTRNSLGKLITAETTTIVEFS